MTRRLFGTLCGLVFLVNFGRVVFAPLVEPLEAAFGIGEATIGLVVTLVWLGTAAPRIPMGYVLTRVPRHRVVLAAGGLLAASSAATAFATSVPMLAAGAFLVGVASGTYFVSAVPLVSRLYPGAMGRSIGIHGTASQFAAVLAPAVVTAVLLLASWREVFLLLALAALVASVLLSRAFRGTEVVADGRPDHDFAGAVRAHWPTIATGVAMVGAAGFVWNGLFNFYVSYLVQAKDLATPTAGLLLSVVFAAGVPAFWYSGRLADRLPHVPYVIAILVAFVACLFALTAVEGLAAIVAVSLVLGYVIHSLFPALDTYVLDSLPEESGASAYAVYTGAALLVEANGSVVVGALTGAGYAFDDVFRALGVGLCLVVGLLIVLARTDRLPG